MTPNKPIEPDASEQARPAVERLRYPPSSEEDGWSEALRNTRVSGQQMGKTYPVIGIPCE